MHLAKIKWILDRHCRLYNIGDIDESEFTNVVCQVYDETFLFEKNFKSLGIRKSCNKISSVVGFDLEARRSIGYELFYDGVPFVDYNDKEYNMSVMIERIPTKLNESHQVRENPVDLISELVDLKEMMRKEEREANEREKRGEDYRHSDWKQMFGDNDLFWKHKAQKHANGDKLEITTVDSDDDSESERDTAIRKRVWREQGEVRFDWVQALKDDGFLPSGNPIVEGGFFDHAYLAPVFFDIDKKTKEIKQQKEAFKFSSNLRGDIKRMKERNPKKTALALLTAITGKKRNYEIHDFKKNARYIERLLEKEKFNVKKWNSEICVGNSVKRTSASINDVVFLEKIVTEGEQKLIDVISKRGNQKAISKMWNIIAANHRLQLIGKLVVVSNFRQINHVIKKIVSQAEKTFHFDQLANECVFCYDVEPICYPTSRKFLCGT